MENKNPYLKNHFMKIKFLITSEWLLEWFLSLVKLHAFAPWINCMSNGFLQYEVWKTAKIRGRSEDFHFQGEGGCPIREGSENFHLGGGWYLAHYAQDSRVLTPPLPPPPPSPPLFILVRFRIFFLGGGSWELCL